jgi:hypothetical protein
VQVEQQVVQQVVQVEQQAVARVPVPAAELQGRQVGECLAKVDQCLDRVEQCQGLTRVHP